MRWPIASPFLDRNCEVWFRAPVNGEIEFACLLDERHENEMGVVHGGFVSTLADIWLGYAAAYGYQMAKQLATVSLSVDFCRPVRSNTWISLEIDSMRLGRNLAFVQGALVQGDARVCAARGVFAISKELDAALDVVRLARGLEGTREPSVEPPAKSGIDRGPRQIARASTTTTS